MRMPRSVPPLRRATRWLRRWGLTLLLIGFALSHLAGLFGERGQLTRGGTEFAVLEGRIQLAHDDGEQAAIRRRKVAS